MFYLPHDLRTTEKPEILRKYIEHDFLSSKGKICAKKFIAKAERNPCSKQLCGNMDHLTK